jgi:hypothetical protein
MVPMRLFTVGLAAAGVATLAWLPPSHLSARGTVSQSAAAPSAMFIDFGAADELNRALTTLRPEDLRVTVDGEVRPVLSLRFVYRGPGSETAAALADPVRDTPAAAERRRAVVVIVDENAVYRGQQKAVVAAVGRLLDELGTSDQAAVVTLPQPSAELVLTSTAAERLPFLARVAGRAALGGLAAAETVRRLDATDPSGDPDEQARLEREREAARDRLGTQLGAAGDRGEGRPAVASLRALRGVIEGLAGLPGLKTLVVFRQAEWTDEMAAPDDFQTDVSAVLTSAARSRVVLHLVEVGQGRKRDAAGDPMTAVAARTGGVVATVKNPSDSKAFDGIRAAMWGAYLVEVARPDGDTPGRPHAVKVECRRPKTTVRAPGLWVSRQDPVPALVAAVPAEPVPSAAPTAAVPAGAPPAAVSPAPAPRPARRAKADDPQRIVLLARLAEYLAAYVREFGNVVGEEDYNQRMIRGGTAPNLARHLKSDLLLVTTGDEVGWTQYRDVFEVDGRPVRDREARVKKLFIENPAEAWRQAREINNESARYNVGKMFRNINTPMLPLEYLSPGRIGGLSFWRDGEDTIDGIRATELAFEETGRPTLVQPDNERADVPATGTFWIDPSNGRILKTRISLKIGRSEMTTTVVYKPVPGLGLWVPAQMNEHYYSPAEEIEGRAVYRNFRSFNVTTDVEIKK